MDTDIKPTGFGGNVVKTELTLLTVISSATVGCNYSVYVFHGTPAYSSWWKSRSPVGRFNTLDQADELVRTLAGLVDSHLFFDVIAQDGAVIRPALNLSYREFLAQRFQAA